MKTNVTRLITNIFHSSEDNSDGMPINTEKLINRKNTTYGTNSFVCGNNVCVLFNLNKYRIDNVTNIM